MKKIILVGCGKMGQALLGGWLDAGVQTKSLLVVEPDPNLGSRIEKNLNVACVTDFAKIPSKVSPQVVLFAVKPQTIDGIITNYSKFKKSGTLFISIAAGKTIKYFEKKLGTNVSVIRAMPNTPAAIKRGITVAFANKHVQASQLKIADKLLLSTGQLEWIKREALIDSVTALSGGGPAYVFLLTECLCEAGIKMGLSKGLSMRLARATVSGAGELMHNSDLEPAMLRQNVTSPGGTTAEALKILMGQNGWQNIITRALKAAKKKSTQLAN